MSDLSSAGFGATSSWIADAMAAIQRSQNPGGILDALRAGNDGCVSSFLGQSTSFAEQLRDDLAEHRHQRDRASTRRSRRRTCRTGSRSSCRRR